MSFSFFNIHSHLVIRCLCVRIDMDTPPAATMTKDSDTILGTA